ncbi:protein disulfide oxidoreductase [Enterovibrio nigricans]|uniref:AhpC/TSA family protein n=1 Tax=Enterovibrio nigricans DSM 22720 TaxID=1121868 RepID=A0A1T4VMQ1_9GAMM|nr:protein disulfide oxidoreductase [Enterovibrio nigricans]PKF49603.1 protein disulfide oxidoreductase [Enterovibrio nigricans]SKA66216.1 AhpC/TSA family protein [Enterovibrio nigricans DSM 22720]
MNSSKKKTSWKQPRFWLREVLPYIALFVAISFAVDLWRSQDMPSGNVPIQQLSTLDGQEINLAEISQDQPVLAYFWATWCGACKFVTPTVNWLSEDYQVVSVAITSGDTARVKRYLAAHELAFETINDESGTLANAWGIQATPTIVIISDGKIKSITTGISSPPGLLARLWFS